jgi:hypothetical protein
VKVGHLQQLGLAILHPGKCLTALTLGAVTVATTNGELTISCLMGKLGNGESRGRFGMFWWSRHDFGTFCSP